jgi:hypothetical protein
MNQIVKAPTPGEIMETVLIKGDLSKLTADERNSYYRAVCESVGLNPFTRPLEYIQLSGRLTLYAKKDCTDQLRSLYKISVTDMAENERDGVYIVTTKVANAEGRTDMAKGAVSLTNLKGEALANAIMKAETKSKRRATLSICGLGLLDETEVDDIPGAQKGPAERPRVPSPSQTAPAQNANPEAPQGPQEPYWIKGGKTADEWVSLYIEGVLTSDGPDVVFKWIDLNKLPLSKLSEEQHKTIDAAVQKHIAFLRKTAPALVSKPDPISTGRPKAKDAMPDFASDYTGWIEWAVRKVAITDAGDDMEALFESFDAWWSELMPPDKDAILSARQEREAEQEP